MNAARCPTLSGLMPFVTTGVILAAMRLMPGP